MFAVTYISSHLPSHTIQADSPLHLRAMELHTKILALLHSSQTWETQTEALFADMLQIRFDLLQESQNEAFLQDYSQTLIENSVNLMNYSQGRLSQVMQNALDFATHIALSFADNLQPQTPNAQYLDAWLSASLNTEIGLVMGDYALENQLPNELQENIADFLKISYERFGAYSLLMDLWHIPVGEIPQYMVNMRIVSRTFKIKRQYPHLHV